LLFRAVGFLIVVGLLAAWKWWPRGGASTRSVPEDPRLTFATPYRNVRPKVRYVGQEVCAGCHPNRTRTYRAHPMGRSLAPVQKATQVERYGAAAKNPFEAQGFRYQVERRGQGLIHRETALDARGRLICTAEAEVQYAIGSGTHARSYLINRDGYLFQSPITWFSDKGEKGNKGAWDLSPGFNRLHHHFGRLVATDCLFCHSNQVHEVADTQNRYRSPVFTGHAIGCERCHGPGELHVRRQQSREAYDGVDDTIVNPRRLRPVLREAVCEQCHLEGVTRVLRRGRQAFEYRPGLPLHLFLSVFVKPPRSADPRQFVGQVEQMHASRCFQKSNGRLGCISCHDPHVQPAAGERVAFYRDRCLRCHADQGCKVPAAVRRQTSQGDSCVQCHMPRGDSDIRHAAITDHRVPRRPGPVARDGRVPAAPAAGEMPLHLFHRDLVGDDPEADRDLGVALVDRVERYPAPVRRRLGELALPRLERALKTDPTDVAAWDARGHALWAVGDLAGAAAAFEEALARAPRREVTLQWAAVLALERRRPAEASPYLERAIAVNPWRHEFHYLLAAAQAQRGDWKTTLRECQRALRLNPAGVGSRKLLVQCYLELGQRDQARSEFERLLGLHPPDEEALRRWFAQRTR
jgi:hypothetical protein